MTPTRNGEVIFSEKISSGYPVPSKTVTYDDTETIDLDNIPLEGGVLIKTLALSVDPYFRGLMAETTDVPGFVLGQPLISYGIGVVLRSDSPECIPGVHVYGMLPHHDYALLHPSTISTLRKIVKHPHLSWATYLGAAGMPGLTAFSGWMEYAPRNGKGLTAFVTAASGPVGSMVVQLAKQDGYKVIASAGSDDKVDFIKSIGADVAFNYKTEDTEDVLSEHGPIDVYWDNVGGKTLESALANANLGARFIECGMVSGYNSEPYGVKNLRLLYTKHITLYGFTVMILGEKYLEEFLAKIPLQLASGQLQHKEDLTYGLDKVGDTILAVQKGENRGKAVIVVAEE
ncbi:NAD(P)-binding protein [Schizophyllum commune H4-8]|uniref:NAD(P)-binding protein n=1 Tax=Schizophyllum commune (strain H4-8 / FGSC 9210) TaxID=578458 RepID=UPI00215F3BF6|nr:NAD(P)-binding protein [Schizophyllum commune H4-8]KAI5886030.1 NAD(P)-binding protein [Schizophyllum commune H4-8]